MSIYVCYVALNIAVINIVVLYRFVWYVMLNIIWYVVECVLDAEKWWYPHDLEKK
jgi:hypothetical protein